MGLFSRTKKIIEAGKALVSIKRREVSRVLTVDEDDRREKMHMFRRAYERIPLITAIIDIQADYTVTPFFFSGPNKVKLEEFADKVNLMRFFHRTAKLMLLYGNAYIEIVKNKVDDIVELKILDPIPFEVYREPTGDITGYGQIIDRKDMILWGTTGDERRDEKFETKVEGIESIVHFRYNVHASDTYGRSIINSMLRDLQLKIDMEEDLKQILFKYSSPMIWAKVGNDQLPASPAQVGSIANTLRDLQSESEITTSHLVELSVLDFSSKGIDLKTPITHVESQIITGGQTPDVLLGRTVDSTEAGTPDIQLRNFHIHIKSVQREVKNEFEDNIIVKQGLGEMDDKLEWEKSENREIEIDTDILRGLVTDGIVTPQKANDLLPPRMQETLPEIVQEPRPNQMGNDKIVDNPNDPTKSTKNPRTQGKRRDKSSREIPNSQRKKKK